VRKSGRGGRGPLAPTPGGKCRVDVRLALQERMRMAPSGLSTVERLATIGILMTVQFQALCAETTDPIASWRSGVGIRTVAAHRDRHVIHSYFNTCPESPDGKYVVYFTSRAANGEAGDIRMLKRSTGRETLLAANITAEDAHRVACQQWCNDGKTIAYHDCRDGQWCVVAVDVATKKTRLLARDRQIGFGSPGSVWAPIYGCHWNPGDHRDLELVNVVTGEIRTAVELTDVVKTYGEWIREEFGSTDVSIFFPVLSPNGKRVFFKMARPGGGTDFRSKKASYRSGKIVYDIAKGRFIRLFKKWGHPSWSPDNSSIFEKGNILLGAASGRSRRCAPSCFSNHPSVAPDGKLFATDADVTKRKLGNPGDWAIAVGSMTTDDFVVLDVFPNARGARSWRRTHPHPVFSADGQRIYYNVSEGPWATLRVATAGGK